ncbi:MAG: caudovirus prohead protease [Ruminococcus sp.]|nr:caudovirus prohead protease [Ruminococcus sp.]
MEKPYQAEACDFSGWATRNDLKCSDGRVIRRDAFKHNDGIKVPLVWNHQHNDPRNVLGHAWLENRDEGVYAYCFFNDSESGEIARTLVKHGDICALSIYANQLQQNGPNVLHGTIREVSLVHAGANPGAFIDSMLNHGEDSDEEAVIYTGMSLSLSHSDNKKGDNTMPNNEKTVQDVIDSMTEEQKNVMYALIGQVLEDANEEDDEKNQNEEESTMKHNVFDNDARTESAYLSHADQESIISLAKSNSVGSLRTAMEIFAEEHSDTLSHGIDNIETLFPEYKDVRPGAPELLTTDQGWVSKVLNKVHKSPISRIRTRQTDVRNIEKLRARGYKKGNKKEYIGNVELIHRTTDPQTVYVKSKLERDDIIDIQDFDVVRYMYNLDRMNLNEELATAIMIGDGREIGADGKIAPDKIRPIWLDDELYTIHTDVDIAGMTATLQGNGIPIQGTETAAHFGENYIYAEAVIQSLLYAREKYKGSGTSDFYCTPHLVNVMLLARDLNGRRIYDKVSDLAAALNVGEIITAEQFEGKTRTTADGKIKKLRGLMCNLSDYSLGATKGGEITHFTDFDIDFNQEKSLLETRCSGALTRVMSAIALEEDVTDNS